MQMSNYYVPCFNRIDFVVIPSYIELPWYILSYVSYSIDIYIVAIKNIRNMHAVSTYQIADILHFNVEDLYVMLLNRGYIIIINLFYE